MIKNGMWFENEGHYRYYLRRTKNLRATIAKLQSTVITPLIKRVKDLLNEPT